MNALNKETSKKLTFEILLYIVLRFRNFANNTIAFFFTESGLIFKEYRKSQNTFFVFINQISGKLFFNFKERGPQQPFIADK